MTDDPLTRLVTLEAAMRQMLLQMSQLNEQGAALVRNDQRLAEAIASINTRLVLQEAATSLYEVDIGITKGAH